MQAYESFPMARGMSTHAGSGNGYAPLNAWSDFNYLILGYTDSAPAATAMSTGRKTYDGAIGVDMAQQPLLHIAERLKQYGKSTGVVSTVEFSHATPAASWRTTSAGTTTPRSRARCCSTEGATSSSERATPTTTTTASRSIPLWMPKYVGGAPVWAALKTGAVDFDIDGDGDIDNSVEDCNGDGAPDAWTLIQERAEVQALASGPTPSRLLVVPQCYTTTQQSRSGNGSADPFVVPLNANVPTLPEMTMAALNCLDNNPDGLFVMVEGRRDRLGVPRQPEGPDDRGDGRLQPDRRGGCRVGRGQQQLGRDARHRHR